MKTSLEERFRKRLIKFGKKNILCRRLAAPVLGAGLFLFHSAAYLGGNVKRLSVLALTFLLFVVYSSFSFPIFAAGNGSGNGLNPVSEEAEDIELAQEREIDLENLELPDDEELMVGEEYAELSLENSDEWISASEILDAVGDTESAGGRQDASSYEDYEFSRDDWKLVLVNKQHSIPEDYEVNLGTIKTLKGTQYCDKRIIEDYTDMLRAAQEDNVALEITSPYRSQEYQEMLFGRKIKAYMGKGLSYMEAYQLSGQAVNVPGTSEHQIGLALDIVTPGFRDLKEEFAETDAGRWLAENSYKYGFILRYPLGKEDITGVEYEPWHFRYVGVEAATVITKKGITLEEFWEDL